MDIKTKRILSVLITAFFTCSAIYFIYEKYQEGKSHKPHVFTKEERRIHNFRECKKEFSTRIADTLILDQFCNCMTDTLISRYTDKEIGELNTVRSGKKYEELKAIVEHCKQSSGYK